MLKNAPTLAIVAVHTAENEPPKVCKSPYFFFFCGGGDKNSRKPSEKTTIYFPLVPKGNYFGERVLENLMKKLAPLYY